VIECDSRLQPLGYLAWAACGKDPGFSPAAILSEARRTSRYSVDEVRQLAFSGPPPDAGDLARRFAAMLDTAAQAHDLLPLDEAGKCVLSTDGHPDVATSHRAAQGVAEGVHQGARLPALSGEGESSEEGAGGGFPAFGKAASQGFAAGGALSPTTLYWRA
jgi:hypothetical protein